jgi:cytochrome c5
MRTLLNSFASVALFAGAAIAVLAQGVTPNPNAKKAHEKKIPVVHQDPAERAFQTHCSRCHSAPETLSPSLSGTVVRHMRVRANLSAEEERLIYSFFNP